jgi:GxxExxY protein
MSMLDSKEGRKAGKELELGSISERVIGAAIAVHKELGPGFIESVYEMALAVEFDACGIRYERQKPVSISYRGAHVGEHRLDFHVEGCLVLELKAVKALEDVHFAIVRSYLKATHLEHGLILNFSTFPLTIKRVIREGRAPKHVIPVQFS